MTSVDRTPRGPAVAPRSALFSALIGLASLGVLLQALWAGLFLGGQGHAWVEVHQHGAEVTTAVALIATIVAVVRLRARRDLWIASALFTVLLVAETFLGAAIEDTRGLTAVHVPLAMVIFGLAVWLPLRHARAR